MLPYIYSSVSCAIPLALCRAGTADRFMQEAQRPALVGMLKHVSPDAHAYSSQRDRLRRDGQQLIEIAQRTAREKHGNIIDKPIEQRRHFADRGRRLDLDRVHAELAGDANEMAHA